MSRKFYEYVLTVRPHRRRTKTAKPRRAASKKKVVRLVARSKFEAELFFRNENPGMTVTDAERGRQVETLGHN